MVRHTVIEYRNIMSSKREYELVGDFGGWLGNVYQNLNSPSRSSFSLHQSTDVYAGG